MTKKTAFINYALGIASMLSMTSAMLAQSTNGSIRAGPPGALIPGAQVTVSTGNGFSGAIKSVATGAFTVSHLVPGSYSVSVNTFGFTPILEGGIQVIGDKVTRENIMLGISVNREIEVSANADDVANTCISEIGVRGSTLLCAVDPGNHSTSASLLSVAAGTLHGCSPARRPAVTRSKSFQSIGSNP